MNEISIDSHYSLSAIVWWLLGMSSVVVIFVLIYKMMILNSVDIGGTANSSQIQIMLSVPALLAYFLMPLAHGIWQKIYGSLYDMWSNFLYAPSWNERAVAAQMTESQEVVEEEINVDAQ